MPPLWYFSRLLKKARRAHRCPKGRESWTPSGSSLQVSRFSGVRHGGQDVFMDPSSVARHLSHLGGRRDARQGHAPHSTATGRVSPVSSAGSSPYGSAQKMSMRLKRGPSSWNP